MIAKGYPEEFSKLIARELSTEFTADRMMRYLSRGPQTLEDIADEMYRSLRSIYRLHGEALKNIRVD